MGAGVGEGGDDVGEVKVNKGKTLWGFLNTAVFGVFKNEIRNEKKK